jgi:arylsulfatase A-like enzyme
VRKAAWNRYKILTGTNAVMIGHADHHLGRLVAALDELRMRENTFIMVVSDNGASPPPVEMAMR